MTQTQYTRQQLIDALAHEYDYLCHDDFDPDVDMSPDEHLEYLNSLSVEQLIDETSTGDGYTLDEYMFNHSWVTRCHSSDCYSEDYDPLSSTQTLQLFTLSIHSHMFIKRTSTAIHCISTDFLNGIVDVMFNNGSVYR